MKIKKQKTNVLFTNEKGEYHLSIEDFDKMGEEKATAFAEKEIEKKFKAEHTSKTINFEQARELGFCEYGIKDFCKQLDLDIEKEYKLEDLNKILTVEVLKQYPSECIKLFGSNTLKYLGGVEGVLSENTIDLVLRPEFIDEKTLHIIATKCAYLCIDVFEKEYPNDDRPRKAIEMKERWIEANFGAFNKR